MDDRHVTRQFKFPHLSLSLTRTDAGLPVSVQYLFYNAASTDAVT